MDGIDGDLRHRDMPMMSIRACQGVLAENEDTVRAFIDYLHHCVRPEDVSGVIDRVLEAARIEPVDRRRTA